MTIRTVTISLPEALYTQLEARAQTASRSVDDVVAQTLVQALPLPPAPEADLPFAVQAELTAMEQLSDNALWAIARSTASDDTVALYDTLVDRQGMGALTPEGQQWLDRLRGDAGALMLRKAHAYALLKARGHTLPRLDDLRAPAP